MTHEPRGKTQSKAWKGEQDEWSEEFQSKCKGNIKILDMRHDNAFESSVYVKGQCMENHYQISLLNKISINLKESLFFQLNSVERCLNSSR